jgi:polysaccharide biosynthesis transport protein
LKDEFDFVLVDAPPLLAVSDPCILARVTDGLLVVTRINKNSRAVTVRVREMIETQGIRVLGAVANGAVMGPGHHGGYYGEYLSPASSTSSHPASSKSVPTNEPVGV